MGPTHAVCSVGQCEARVSGADGGTAFVDDETRCLPAVVCDEWAGCASASGNNQDGWFIRESPRVSSGEIAGLERVATTDKLAVEAFRLYPPGVDCPPQSIPPLLPRPPSTCRDEGGHCKASPRK